MSAARVRSSMLISLAILFVGCESDSTPNFGQVRLINDSLEPVQLLVSGEKAFTVQPGNKNHTSVDEGIQQIVIQDLAGGQLFGFLGILLALPVAAALNVLVRHLHNRYRRSNLYTQPKAEVEEV